MLKGSGERGHPCLVPELIWKVYRVSHSINSINSINKYDVRCRFFVDSHYQVEKVPSIPSLLRVFIMSVRFCHMLFLSFFFFFKVHNSMVYSIFTDLCNQHQNQF